MFEPSEKRKLVETKLEREMKNLNLLKEKINRSNQLTKGMLNILSSCNHHLAHAEETILPIYNQTDSLRNQQRNLKYTLKVLDHVIVFYNTSKEVEPIIRAGPNFSPNSGLQRFLEAMDKLQAAIEYFQFHNCDHSEYVKVRMLFDVGLNALNQQFKELLHDNSQLISIATLLDLVSPTEETQVKAELSSLVHMPDFVKLELKNIAKWLKENFSDGYIDEYVEIRANTLLKSIQNLIEHQRTSSGSSVHSNSATNSPVLRLKFRQDSSSSLASKLLQNLFEKKSKKMLKKASSSSDYSGFTIGMRRSGILSAIDIRDDAVNEQEMVNYLMCVVALQKLMQSEKALMLDIIPQDLLPNVFEKIIHDALDTVVQDGESIAVRTKNSINHHEFTTVLVVFSVLKHLQSTLPEFKTIVEHCSESIRSKFSSTYDTLHHSAARALDDFVESIRMDQSTQVPKDGTVHEISSNSLIFLEQLFDFSDMVGGILAQKFEYNNALTLTLFSQMLSGYGQRDKNKLTLGMYILKVLNELNHTLQNKSKLYNDIYLRAVFLLNNTYQILKTVQESGLNAFVELSQPDFESRYYKMINDDKDAYIQSWNKLLSHIWPNDPHLVDVSASKMRDKDKSIIKQKFSGFNKELEDIVKVQRGYSIANDELRKNLKEDIKNLVLPKYTMFHKTYSKIPFTKNPKKYIKFTPEQVSLMIQNLFDVAA